MSMQLHLVILKIFQNCSYFPASSPAMMRLSSAVSNPLTFGSRGDDAYQRPSLSFSKRPFLATITSFSSSLLTALNQNSP